MPDVLLNLILILFMIVIIIVLCVAEVILELDSYIVSKTNKRYL